MIGVMDLSEYVKQQYGRAAELAKELCIPPILISQWSLGQRPVPIERCYPIEVATGGRVTRKDLRPDDWPAIWPELRAAAEGEEASA